MALNISCPQCKGEFRTSETFPGSRILCPQCRSCLILDFRRIPPEKGMVVESTARAASPEDSGILRQQARRHLEDWLDIPADEVEKSLRQIESNEAYTLWTIPKGNGSVREITSPCESLKNIQRRILDRILYRIPVSNAAHGFVPGRSIVTNAQYHLKTAEAVFNIDLKDAFPSVNRERVKQIFVRYVKIPLKHLGQAIPQPVLNEAMDILVQLTTFRNQLPQGGPCSGCLLNLGCITLDKNIYRLLKNHGDSYRYTRYADDMTISSPTSISPALQQEIQKVVHNCGYQVNPRKCSYSQRAKGQMLKVTGLVLEKDKVRIPAQKLEAFRSNIHNACQLKTEELTPEKRLEIQSILAFVKMVYPKVPARIWGPYRAYMEKHGIAYPRKATRLYLDLYPKNDS